VLKTWLTGVNPLADPRLSATGTLTFSNAAVDARVATAPDSYTLTWARFDNATGQTAGDSVETRVSVPEAAAPAGVLANAEYVSVAVRTSHPDYPQWASPVNFVFRRGPDGWQTVGLSR
jgi:hypothetical protein